MRRFDLSPAAAADLEAIAAFLEERAPHATNTVLDALLHAMRRLAEMPGLGPLREDLTGEPLRFHAVWSYLAVSRVTECVEIVRVLHAAHDVVRKILEP